MNMFNKLMGSLKTRWINYNTLKIAKKQSYLYAVKYYKNKTKCGLIKSKEKVTALLNKDSMWEKFKNGYLRLIFLFVISIISGLALFLIPEKTPEYVIRVIGFIWILEGISHFIQILKKNINK